MVYFWNYLDNELNHKETKWRAYAELLKKYRYHVGTQIVTI